MKYLRKFNTQGEYNNYLSSPEEYKREIGYDNTLVANNDNNIMDFVLIVS